MMNRKFEVGKIYYTNSEMSFWRVIRRTDKTVWFCSAVVEAKPFMKRINVDMDGNEYVKFATKDSICFSGRGTKLLWAYHEDKTNDSISGK